MSYDTTYTIHSADIQIRKLAHRVDGLKKDTPTLTLSSFIFDKFIGTATITYDGDGELSTTVGTISGNTLTISFNLYEKITGTLSASETKDYYATSIEFEATNYYGYDYLVAYLPFDTSPTEDLCGGTWTTVGTVSIQDSALWIDASNSYIKRTNGYTLGGQDFTVCGYMLRVPNQGQRFYYFSYTESGAYNRIYPALTSDSKFKLNSFGEKGTSVAVEIPDDWFHWCTTYNHSKQKMTGFINGVKKLEMTTNIPRTNFAMFNINANTRDGGTTTAKMRHWKCYDGIELWTEDFTPPTATDYAVLKAMFAS